MTRAESPDRVGLRQRRRIEGKPNRPAARERLKQSTRARSVRYSGGLCVVLYLDDGKMCGKVIGKGKVRSQRLPRQMWTRNDGLPLPPDGHFAPGICDVWLKASFFSR